MVLTKFIAKKFILIAVILLVIKIAGCSFLKYKKSDGPPKHKVDLSCVSDAIPKAEPKSKYGNPDSYKVFGKKYFTLKHNNNFNQTGMASWYGTKFHGKKTSSGELYNMYEMTAAHKSLPLPTYAKVTNLENNKSIIVKINDRGPFYSDRILDLSYAAAHKLDMLKKGTAKIRLSAIATKQKLSNKTVMLQIGAFSERYNADKLRHEIKNVLDYPIKISGTKTPTSSTYKVILGPVPANSSKINHIKNKLAKHKILDPIVMATN